MVQARYRGSGRPWLATFWCLGASVRGFKVGDKTKTTIWVLLIIGTAVGLLRIYGYVTDAAQQAAQQKALVHCFEHVLATAPDEGDRKLGMMTCIMENPEPPDPRLHLCFEQFVTPARDKAQRDLEAEKCFNKYLGPPPSDIVN